MFFQVLVNRRLQGAKVMRKTHVAMSNLPFNPKFL